MAFIMNTMIWVIIIQRRPILEKAPSKVRFYSNLSFINLVSYLIFSNGISIDIDYIKNLSKHTKLRQNQNILKVDRYEFLPKLNRVSNMTKRKEICIKRYSEHNWNKFLDLTKNLKIQIIFLILLQVIIREACKKSD